MAAKCMHCKMEEGWHHFKDGHCLNHGIKLETKFTKRRSDNTGKRYTSENMRYAREQYPDITPKSAYRRIMRCGGAARLKAMAGETRALFLGSSGLAIGRPYAKKSL